MVWQVIHWIERGNCCTFINIIYINSLEFKVPSQEFWKKKRHLPKICNDIYVWFFFIIANIKVENQLFTKFCNFHCIKKKPLFGLFVCTYYFNETTLIFKAIILRFVVCRLSD